jgi:anaerobic ribonucleoside-triphosphate reductase activating protein
MNYADIRKYDTANGTGISSSIFFSGCNFKCKGCFNQDAQDFNYGQPYTKEVEDLFISYLQNEHVSHASLLGGETFQQDLPTIYNLVRRIRIEVNKPIWVWTGYIWQNLINSPRRINILKNIDVVIDGQFKEELKDFGLLWRGSKNQRVIDVQESLKRGEVVLYVE